jgi:HNH endonuclease
MEPVKKYIIKPCEECGTNHQFDAKEINRGFGKFCSRRCASLNRVKNLIPPENNVKCALCGVDFYLNDSKQKNSKSGLFFCSREHKDAAQKVGGIQAIQPSHYGTGDPENTYRRIAFAVKPKVCERCGFDQEAAIIVHHRDRDRQNNDIANLEVLCANCHAIEHWENKENP